MLIKEDSPKWFVTIITSYMLVTAPIVQLFVILWWDALVAQYTISATANFESISWIWIYRIIGFIAAFWPLFTMAGEEEHADLIDGDSSDAKTWGRLLFVLVSAVGFVVFNIDPFLMYWSYGWFLRWWFHLAI